MKDEEYEVINVFIDEQEIAEYLWDRLLSRGYVPESDEILDLAEIVFDFLVDKMVIDETDVEDVD